MRKKVSFSIRGSRRLATALIIILALIKIVVVDAILLPTFSHLKLHFLLLSSPMAVCDNQDAAFTIFNFSTESSCCRLNYSLVVSDTLSPFIAEPCGAYIRVGLGLRSR